MTETRPTTTDAGIPAPGESAPEVTSEGRVVEYWRNNHKDRVAAGPGVDGG
jgi:hypothetical protein